MKTLIINTLYPPYLRGGAEQSIQHLAEALVRGGCDVIVVATAPRDERRTVIENGVKVIFSSPANLHWPYDGRQRSSLVRKLWHAIDVYNPWMRATVGAIIRRERPDVVHTNNLQGFSTSVWHPAHAAQRPIVHTLRDYSLSCERACRYRYGRVCAATCWDCRPLTALRRRASVLVGAVVGNSRNILDRHRSLGFFSQARLQAVIPPSCPVVRRSPRPGREPVVFGYLGRLEPAKGVDLVVEEFAKRAPGGWELRIAGTGAVPFVQQLQARLADMPARAAVRFVGWTEAEPFVRDIDVLIVPSRWDEPLPRVVLEAAAYGIPVIASRRGGIPEVVADGVSGLLFDPDNPDTLTAAIDSLIQNPIRRRTLAERAAAGLSAYAPDATARRYLEAYAAVI